MRDRCEGYFWKWPTHYRAQNGYCNRETLCNLWAGIWIAIKIVHWIEQAPRTYANERFCRRRLPDRNFWSLMVGITTIEHVPFIATEQCKRLVVKNYEVGAASKYVTELYQCYSGLITDQSTSKDNTSQWYLQQERSKATGTISCHKLGTWLEIDCDLRSIKLTYINLENVKPVGRRSTLSPRNRVKQMYIWTITAIKLLNTTCIIRVWGKVPITVGSLWWVTRYV